VFYAVIAREDGPRSEPINYLFVSSADAADLPVNLHCRYGLILHQFGLGCGAQA
jgi:hypothetical protein